MRTLKHPVFLSCVGLAIVNRILEMNGVYLPVIHSYLDDILCFPIVLTVGLSAYRFLWDDYRLTAWHIWPTVAVYSIYFEAYLPTVSSVYTRDPIDIVAYIIGALIFDRWINVRPEYSFGGVRSIS